MALEMKPNCEKCNADLPQDKPAFICSYECTFCPQCAMEMKQICPNCGGDLTPKPRRVPK